MRIAFTLWLTTALAAPLTAQPAQLRVGGPMTNAAEFLLSNTTTLELTNEQVVRLAEIARAAAARRAELQEGLEASRPDAQPTPEARQELMQRMRESMEEIRAHAEEEREQAIAVLTPEQQARAWELLARRGSAVRLRAGAVIPRQEMMRERMRDRLGPPGIRQRRDAPESDAPLAPR